MIGIAPHDTDNNCWHKTPGGSELHVNGLKGFISDPTVTGWYRGTITNPKNTEAPILDQLLGTNFSAARRAVEGLIALATGRDGDRQLSWHTVPVTAAMAGEEYVGPHGHTARLHIRRPYGDIAGVAVYHGHRKLASTTSFHGCSPAAVAAAKQWALDTLRARIIAAAKNPDLYRQLPVRLPDAEDLDAIIDGIADQQEALAQRLEDAAVTRIARYFRDRHPTVAEVELGWNDDGDALAVIGAYDSQRDEVKIDPTTADDCPWAAHLSTFSQWLGFTGEFWLLNLTLVPGYTAAAQS